ncbi:MAG: hypothetical protein ACREYF_08320 [Gammaproteobacteria bacterium]
MVESYRSRLLNNATLSGREQAREPACSAAEYREHGCRAISRISWHSLSGLRFLGKQGRTEAMLRLTGLLIVVLCAGCASTARLATDMSFVNKMDKIHKNVLLDIPAEAKAYVAEASVGLQKYRVPIGQALEPNALVALKSVIASVTTGEGSDAADRVVVLSIAPGTGMDLGTFTFSENGFTTVLKCDIKTGGGKVVWSKVIRAQSTGRRAGQALLEVIPIVAIHAQATGNTGHFGALQDAANDSLAQALQQLADEIYKAKVQVF